MHHTNVVDLFCLEFFHGDFVCTSNMIDFLTLTCESIYPKSFLCMMMKVTCPRFIDQTSVETFGLCICARELKHLKLFLQFKNHTKCYRYC